MAVKKKEEFLYPDMERSRCTDKWIKSEECTSCYLLSQKGKKWEYTFIFIVMHKEILEQYIKKLITIQLPKERGRDKGRKEKGNLE